MAAVIGTKERNIEFSGQSCSVPAGDLPAISYYLNCINSLLVSHDISRDLLEYRSTRCLSASKCDALIGIAYLFSPEELINKLVLVDDDHQLLPRGNSNKFLNLNEVTSIIAIASDQVVGGKHTEVTKVMLCTTKWLENYWIVPMKNLKYRLANVAGKSVNDIEKYLVSVEFQLQLHCLAKAVGRLEVSSSSSQQQQRHVQEISKHCGHCKGLGAECACKEGCPRKAQSECTDHPTVTCDHCRTLGLRGNRYKCTSCNDFDLCESCYSSNWGGHLRCSFYRIRRQGDICVELEPRQRLDHPNTRCDLCMKSGFDGPRYKCQQCPDYDLCGTCYTAKADSHISHRFWLVPKEGSQQIDQKPRHAKPPATAPDYNYGGDPVPFAQAVPINKSTSNLSATVPYYVPSVEAMPVSGGGGGFTQGQRVRITGLPSDPANGCCGVVEKSVGGDRYIVTVPTGKKVFQSKNLEGVFEGDPNYPIDACVELNGLVASSQDNGKYGVIAGNAPNGKIIVRLLDENRTVSVKKENVIVIAEAS